MRGRRHGRVVVACVAMMTPGCGDMVGIGPLEVDAPPESATSPTTPPPPRGDDAEPPRSSEPPSELDPSPSPTCTEKETPFVAPRIVFNSGGGSAWDMTNAVKNQDDVSARAIPDLSTNDTQRLVALGFGFAIPPNARIRSVTIEIRVRQGFGPANGTRDKFVGLAPFDDAANLKMDTPYSDTFMTRTYGGDVKRWGAKLTPKMIDAPEFGVVFQSARTVYPYGTSVEVDVLQMKIAYCE